MSPNEKEMAHARATIAFDLAARVVIGRKFVAHHPSAKQGTLSWQIMGRNRAMMQAVRHHADHIINLGYKNAALKKLSFTP